MVEHRPLLSSSSAYKEHVNRTIDRLDQLDRELAIARGEDESGRGEEIKGERGGNGGKLRRIGYFEEERRLLQERLEDKGFSISNKNNEFV